jgi:2'-5' RNA ligase
VNDHADTLPHSRVFFALWPPEHVLEDLKHDLAAIRRDSPESMHWQPPHRLHVTMLFLGAAGDSRIARARRIGRRVAASTAPGPLISGGAGTFGSVVWLGVDGDWLAELNANLRRALGVARERHPFRPHMTLARSRDAAPAIEVVDRLRAMPPTTWTPSELTLVSSQVGPHPSYEVIERLPFGPAHSH